MAGKKKKFKIRSKTFLNYVLIDLTVKTFKQENVQSTSIDTT